MNRRRGTRSPKGYTYLGSAARLRASRRRRVLKGIALGGLAMGLAGLGYGVSRLVDWARESDAFVLKEIHVLGNQKLAVSDVAAAAGIDAGANLLRISPKAIERSVSALPQVKRVFVQKRLPDKLVIRVAERKPCFLVNCGCLWLVDREGAVLGRAGARDVERFTMVAGLTLAPGSDGNGGAHGGMKGGGGSGTSSTQEARLRHPENAQAGEAMRLEPGARLDRQAVARVLDTISALEKCSPDLPRVVSEICHTPDAGLVLFTSDPPHRVLLGRERPLAESLVALGPVLDDLKRRGLVGMEVDLRFERQLVVRAPEGRVALKKES